MEELKLQIHQTLQEFLGEYIPVQELTHAANEICKTIKKDGTYDNDVLLNSQSYLQKQDKEFLTVQTLNTKSITNNQLILAMHGIRKIIAAYKETLPKEII